MIFSDICRGVQSQLLRGARLRVCCSLNHTGNLHSICKFKIQSSESASLKTRYNHLNDRYQMTSKISDLSDDVDDYDQSGVFYGKFYENYDNIPT